MTARKKPLTGGKASPAAKKTPATKAAPAKAKGGKTSAEAVNLGHILALRPKANTSFPQSEFLKARRELAGESYGSIEEAARAVAEKALAAANRKPTKHSIGRP